MFGRCCSGPCCCCCCCSRRCGAHAVAAVYLVLGAAICICHFPSSFGEDQFLYFLVGLLCEIRSASLLYGVFKRRHTWVLVWLAMETLSLLCVIIVHVCVIIKVSGKILTTRRTLATLQSGISFSSIAFICKSHRQS